MVVEPQGYSLFMSCYILQATVASLIGPPPERYTHLVGPPQKASFWLLRRGVLGPRRPTTQVNDLSSLTHLHEPEATLPWGLLGTSSKHLPESI